MKQILQNLRSGGTGVAEVPCPAVARGELLIRTSVTLISAGTERMLVSFGRASLLGKARAQPERVREVLDKIRTDGLVATLGAVFNKLDRPLPLGYCNVGVVLAVGEDVTGFAVGDRVASNGGHAEVVSVPKHLCARIPEGVADEAAVFTVIGAIGLEGVRLLEPTLGEAVVVTGLGLVGLITLQLLRANGCRVLGLDYDAGRLRVARSMGAEVADLTQEDVAAAARAFSRGRGVDGVIITASTRSSEPVHDAATMCRKRVRIVLVGVTGLELSRADFYEKELSFRVSCSYGPGRYDPTYEETGVDYPVGFVRWTEQRNFEAVLDMLADGRVTPAPLISHRFSVTEAAAAYDLVAKGEGALGILFTYAARNVLPDEALQSRTVALAAAHPGPPALGFIGAGNYAGAMLIPAFKACGARLRAVTSSGGLSGAHLGRKYGFESTTTDTAAVLADPQVDAVVVVTRHDSHASLVQAALEANKHVFVEKPLALTLDELTAIEASQARHRDRMVMVGFNRRFAPQVQRIKQLLASVREPAAFVMTVNAGAIPSAHWTQDRAQGGGRIIGEACHFIDLLRFLAGAPIRDHHAAAMRGAPGVSETDDKVVITLRFSDGSLGTIAYLANGHKSFPKERLEVFAGGGILQLDNFRRLRAFGWPGYRGERRWRQDKGQRACAAAFLEALGHGGPSPIPLDELLEVGRVTVAVAASLR